MSRQALMETLTVFASFIKFVKQIFSSFLIISNAFALRSVTERRLFVDESSMARIALFCVLKHQTMNRILTTNSIHKLLIENRSSFVSILAIRFFFFC